MSTKSKGVTIDQVNKLFNKVDLDDRIVLFNQLKSSLTEQILERAKEHEEKSTTLLQQAENLNK